MLYILSMAAAHIIMSVENFLKLVESYSCFVYTTLHTTVLQTNLLQNYSVQRFMIFCLHSMQFDVLVVCQLDVCVCR